MRKQIRRSAVQLLSVFVFASWTVQLSSLLLKSKIVPDQFCRTWLEPLTGSLASGLTPKDRLLNSQSLLNKK